MGIGENDVRELFALFCIVLCVPTYITLPAEANEPAKDVSAGLRAPSVSVRLAARLTHEQKRKRSRVSRRPVLAQRGTTC